MKKFSFILALLANLFAKITRKQATVKITLTFWLSCLLFTSCHKETKKEIMGQWKLVEVSYYDDSHCMPVNTSVSEIDYSENNLIYNFQKYKLVVTGSQSWKLQKNKFPYKYVRIFLDCEGDIPGYVNNLLIDEEEYQCVVVNDTMWIHGVTKSKKIVDEIDLAITEENHIYKWIKIFVKSK
jgi:disulfide oxidoreductase YuzD